MQGEGGSDDLLRRFEAAISGMELDDLRSLATDIAALGRVPPSMPERPHLRRPAHDRVFIYRVRVDLDRARPPIWRRLDLRSDLTLDVVHQVLQAAFGWLDYHLYRFSLGGGAFDPGSEMFLCPFDVREGEVEGEPVSEVRLDETLQEAGDVLHYLYDYGDSWELSIRLEGMRPAEERDRLAVCVDGRRAAPPEDCGGLTTAEELAEVLEDPALFDHDQVNAALDEPQFTLRENGVPAPLVELITRLGETGIGADLRARLESVLASTPEPTDQEKAAALRPFMWYLERARGEGIELTKAGYMRPADVEEASRLVPAMSDWIGKKNREADSYPLLRFREGLQDLGLLRKYKGRLRLSKAGAAVADDPGAVWDLLARKLIQPREDSFENEANLLLLAYAAFGADGVMPLDEVALAMAGLGWIWPDGHPLSSLDLPELRPDTIDILRNVGAPSADTGLFDRVTPMAAALARTALLAGS